MQYLKIEIKDQKLNIKILKKHKIKHFIWSSMNKQQLNLL